ncbi:MAG: hypothetical protein ACRDK3_14255 [Actinomycetota bacterium]
MGATLIVIGAVAIDWGIAFVVWRGFTRLLRRPVPERVSAVMPWVLFQSFLLVGLIVTGALARAGNGAIVLTAIPLALFAAFFAVPVALFKARGGRTIDWRLCLDHSYATAVVWGVLFVVGLVV